MIGFDLDEIIRELFDSFSQRCQEGWKMSMKGRHCLWLCRWITLQLSQVSGVVDLTEIHLDRLKTKQKQKNQSKSKQLRCVSYVCGNSRTEPWKLENNLQIIATTRPFIDQHDYKEINFPARKKDWKKFEKKNSFHCFFYQTIWSTRKNKTSLYFQAHPRAWTPSYSRNDDRRRKATLPYCDQLVYIIKTMITVVWIVSIHSEQKANLNHMRCARIIMIVM